MNTIRISDIVVGERRRQEYGNIRELAESIREYGLLHPVVIDGANRLVAGGRRLKACQMLGMVEVPIRRLQELSEKDLRTIELEENLRRKDLTEIEKSRNMVELAEIKAEYVPAVRGPGGRFVSAKKQGDEPSMPGDQDEFRTPSVQNSEADLCPPRGHNPPHRPVEPTSLRTIANEIGVSRSTLSEARQHVAAVDKYPALEELPKKEAIKTAKELDKQVSQDTPYSQEMERLNRECRLRSKLSSMFQSTMFFGDDAIPETVKVFMEQFNEPDRPDQLINKLDICINILQKMRAEALKYKTLRVVK